MAVKSRHSTGRLEQLARDVKRQTRQPVRALVTPQDMGPVATTPKAGKSAEFTVYSEDALHEQALNDMGSFIQP